MERSADYIIPLVLLYPTNKMSDTSVFISGYIMDSHLISPSSNYGSKDKFTVKVNPDHAEQFLEIERRVDTIKRMNESPFINPDSCVVQHKDAITDGCSLVFTSLHQPKLRGELDVSRDEELTYKHINILGHIQVLPDGNAFMSISEIYASPAPSFDDGFVDGEIDDDDW